MKISLKEKIIELFEYRRLPELMKIGNDGVLDQSFYDLLIRLQTDIYHLDAVLESGWEVDMSLIDARWTAINESLRQLGVIDSMLHLYSRHIKKYQKHELDIRDLKYPTRLTMEYFYFYKSCDVKLLRKLIYDRYPVLEGMVKLTGWRLFDLITEVDDDVEDIYEDLDTINGNRFLLSMILHGKDATAKKYRDYMNEIKKRLMVSETDELDTKELSQKLYKDTEKLLEKRLKEVTEEECHKAIIANHIAVEK